MPTYLFGVDKPRLKSQELLIRLMHMISGCILIVGAWAFIFIAYYFGAPPVFIAGIVLGILGVSNMILTFFPKRIFSDFPRTHLWIRVITLIGLGWFFFRFLTLTSPIVGIFILVIILAGIGLLWLEKKSSHEVPIKVNENGILLPGSLLQKLRPWSAINHVILHNGLLTLDLKTNRVIQVEILDKLSADEEDRFNMYCAGFLKTQTN